MTRIAVVFIFLATFGIASAEENLTLESVLERLINETARARIDSGQYAVARAKYNAERIGYYLPEISFNSTLPSYGISETYQNYSGAADPIPFKGVNASGYGNIQLRQKVITGGDLIVQGRVDISNREYPDPLYEFSGNRLIVTDVLTATDKRRLRDFRLEFSQPLLRTSESRSAYLTARSNLKKSEMEWRQARADLKKEGITAYFDLLTADVDQQIAESNSRLGAFNAKWDSVKFVDSVITEEAWIESMSARLEKRLTLFDAAASFEEKSNDFNHLLDYPSGTQITPEVPPVPALPDAARMQMYLENAELGAETELARIRMETSEQELREARSSTGLNGTLNAVYAVGRGTVTRSKEEGEVEDEIKTNDWRVSLDFTYPIWDGGASHANIHSQELAYESVRLEYLAARRNARNKMEILLKRIDINHSKLSLLNQELDLAEKKLRDAEERFDAGMISEGTLLENGIYYFEARKNRLVTLKDFYLDLTELEKTGLP